MKPITNDKVFFYIFLLSKIKFSIRLSTNFCPTLSNVKLLNETSLLYKKFNLKKISFMASIFPLFVPAIRDYIDVLNNIYDSVSNDINLQQVLQQSFLFILTSIKFFVLYFLSFQWLQDLTYLPVLVPQLKMEILKEHFFLQTPQSNFFTFLEISNYTNNKFLLGFLNSFFLCLPLSVAHIISTRRLLIQGLAAGISSSLGTIFGQILLLTCILFGCRFFVVPWFNFQVVNYFLGIILVLNIVYDMAHERSIRIIDISNKPLLLKIFFLNFALAWTEQSCIFQYFGNLTLGAEPTIVEIFSSPSELQSILTHTSYIIGLIVGSLVFTGIFSFICLKISNFLAKFLSPTYTRWIRRLNFSLITLILAFTFTSIPFYSFDYLVLSNLGFVSQDKSFKDTIFLPTKVYDHDSPLIGDASRFSLDKKPGIDTDISAFDKGRYLMFDLDDSFEQLNYQGEYAWLSKPHRTPKISRSPSSSSALSSFSQLFQKTKKSSNVSTKNTSSKSLENTSQLQTKKNSFSPLALQGKGNNTSFSDSEDFNDSETPTSDDLDNSIGVLYSRSEHELQINELLEPMLNTTFSTRFLTNSEAKPILEKKLKQKYYSNPVYKLLLSADIDCFLTRQPRSFALTAKQENELFQKRLVLANYYDSLRYYNQLPYSNEFQNLFSGSKSYADRVYNQQFKGTLKIVRRLFSITLDPEVFEKQENENLSFALQSNESNGENKKNRENLVLKFDQPLFNKLNNDKNLNVGKFHPIYHEEFVRNKNKNTPFIKLANPIPFYVGWDEQLRKLVITNRLLPRSFAGYSMKFPNKTYSNDYSGLKKLIEKNKTIDFTTWPVPSNILENSQSSSTISYTVLFNSLNNVDNEAQDDLSYLAQDEKTHGKITTIPSNLAENIRKADQRLTDVLPPTRGGFVWPGHSSLKFKIKNLITKSK